MSGIYSLVQETLLCFLQGLGVLLDASLDDEFGSSLFELSLPDVFVDI